MSEAIGSWIGRRSLHLRMSSLLIVNYPKGEMMPISGKWVLKRVRWSRHVARFCVNFKGDVTKSNAGEKIENGSRV